MSARAMPSPIGRAPDDSPAAVRERPIVMGAESVRAVLAGTKTQTRRVVTPQPPADLQPSVWTYDPHGNPRLAVAWQGPWPNLAVCPYGWPGDQLYVKEAWAPAGQTLDGEPEIVYRADRPQYAGRWQSPLFMRKADSRLWLEITAVRVERLDSITAEDALAEGMTHEPPNWPVMPQEARDRQRIVEFRAHWDRLNERRGFGWDTRPWVWVIAFRRVEL